MKNELLRMAEAQDESAKVLRALAALSASQQPATIKLCECTDEMDWKMLQSAANELAKLASRAAQKANVTTEEFFGFMLHDARDDFANELESVLAKLFGDESETKSPTH